MKLRIDSEACMGHGRCHKLAPELFDADDRGYGVVKQEQIDEDALQAAETAVRSCPEMAISIEQD